MADPEQIYEEVKQEEQSKGSSPGVIEGRAKAARQRAVEGSPHPKEAKWWPGSQPQFESDGSAEPAPEDAEDQAPAEQPVAQAPAEQPAAQAPAEQPAAQAPAEQPVAQAPAEQPVAQAPAEQPVAQAPAEQPVAQAPAEPAPAPAQQPAAGAPPAAPSQAPQPAAAAPGGTATLTESPPRVGTLGVSHGTPTGNRLRPEDSVSTDVQFEAQQAVYERRKMIDELVSSGVPAVTASDERSGSGFLALLYLLIPLVAVFILAGQNSSSTSEEAPSGAEGGASGGAAAPQGDVQVSAEGLAFDTDTIELAADKPQTIGFANEDTADHNISIYESADDAGSQSNALFEGEVISAGASTTYDVDPIPKGNYPFQCDIHPTMAGETVVG